MDIDALNRHRDGLNVTHGATTIVGPQTAHDSSMRTSGFVYTATVRGRQERFVDDDNAKALRKTIEWVERQIARPE